MSKRVADLLVETLHAAGVRTCYGIVGDTMNRIAHAIDRSQIDWVHMRHEEAGAFAAAAEALLTDRLTACAGTCGPGSLHFINGLYEANRNRAPVILIATQIVRQDLGFESIQEIDYDDVFKGCSVYQDRQSLHRPEGILGGASESVATNGFRHFLLTLPALLDSMVPLHRHGMGFDLTNLRHYALG
jgi:thiamine pyrophosphate-dependent acetolactate synthase large subunit-like protein